MIRKLVSALVFTVLFGCKTGPIVVGDASTTGAELPLEPAKPDAGTLLQRGDASVSTGATAILPAWVPKDAPLTIVPAGDRDRNLGIATPAPGTSIGIDAGAVQLEIKVR